MVGHNTFWLMLEASFGLQDDKESKSGKQIKSRMVFHLKQKHGSSSNHLQTVQGQT